MVLDINKELKENQSIIILVPKTAYSKKVISIAKEISEKGKTFYININKPSSSLIKTFNENDIPRDKFVFLDEIIDMKKSKDGILLLTEISLSISKLFRKEKIDYLLFDSLSDILTHEGKSIIVKFIHLIISKIRIHEKKCILLCTIKDFDSYLMENMNLFIDKIVVEK